MGRKIISHWPKRLETVIDMGRKKSLGHSPLGYDFDDGLTFDFIPDLNEPMIKVVDHPDRQKQNKPPAKVVVSYYIEEHIVDKVRKIAHLTEQSYSAIASSALSEYLQNGDF